MHTNGALLADIQFSEIHVFLSFCSNFSDIFDVNQFISYLAKDVKIIKELPLRKGQLWHPYTMRVPRKCNDRCYINRVAPVLAKKQVSF